MTIFCMCDYPFRSSLCYSRKITFSYATPSKQTSKLNVSPMAIHSSGKVNAGMTPYLCKGKPGKPRGELRDLLNSYRDMFEKVETRNEKR